MSCNKYCYTEREAGEILNKIHGKHYGCGKKKEVPKRKYYCDDCKAYHLTHLGYYDCKSKRKKRKKR